MHRTIKLAASAALTALLATTGCVALAAAGAGAGTYAYVTGDLEKNIEAPLDEVYQASLAVMEQLGYTTVDNRKDGLEARIKALQADDTAVKITLKSKSDSLTRTGIRIGMFGDEAQSALILQKIEARLATSP